MLVKLIFGTNHLIDLMVIMRVVLVLMETMSFMGLFWKCFVFCF